MSFAWWRNWPKDRLRPASALAALSLLQFALGFGLFQPGMTRPMALAWTHAMIACALALLLAGFAARRA